MNYRGWVTKYEQMAERLFRNHIARVDIAGNLVVISWRKKTGGMDCFVRYIIDEELCTLVCTGDLGDLTARNYNNMQYDRISDFFGDYWYFLQKVNAAEDGKYGYDPDAAYIELKQYLLEDDIAEKEKEKRMDLIDRIMDEFTELDGAPEQLYEEVETYDPDAWDWYYTLGRMPSGHIIILLYGLEMAFRYLKSAENGSLAEAA